MKQMALEEQKLGPKERTVPDFNKEKNKISQAEKMQRKSMPNMKVTTGIGEYDYNDNGIFNLKCNRSSKR